ncbi:HTH domain-containing protein [Rhizobium sp. CCGE 510]|uniref:HTH domain-containing protein n=1 Tax=Rhizobium sp. CCGE 510 TaxID=1132836 RepID=UPI0012F66078|nr:HTH domain-containing protein [Rhizobium sp. CCGE 510]
MEDVTYLWVAETVLRKHKRPLTARALVDYGLEDELFPAVGLSHTPQKSMQARLSIDILNNENSPFVRTGRGRFFLREFLQPQGRDDPKALKIYQAERRAPTPSAEMVLCVPREVYKRFLNYQGVGNIGQSSPLDALASHELVYMPRSEAETNDAYKQVITYTVIQYQSKILSFRRGLYNRAAKFLRGAQCVGFGGHVTDDDRDLFSFSDLGIRQNAAREISEELMLPHSRRPAIDLGSLEFLGVLNDDSSDVGIRHMAIVLRYWVEDWSQWKSVGRGEASINRIRWLDTSNETINLSEFEYWSQLVMRSFFKSSMKMVPSYKVQRKSVFKQPHILCVVGSIGSGKSKTSDLFRERFGYQSVNSGQVLANLMDMPPIPSTPRSVFQAAAEEFITSPGGPDRLGAALALAASSACYDRILIDGIRHPETLERLRQNATLPVALLYVYTPPDVAFEMYRDREGHHEGAITFPDFVQLYTAPVESKIRYMTGEADIITFNWLGLEDYARALAGLMEELHAY